MDVSVASHVLTWCGHQDQAAATLTSLSFGEWPAVAPGASAVGDTGTPERPDTCSGPEMRGPAYSVWPSASVPCGQ